MKPVQRSEILDYVTYEEQRSSIRQRIFEIKRPRRIHLGDHLTFLFENTDTTRYQVQEMVRAERMVKEADIQHELDTYNGLLGGDGQLSCALLIEIEDKSQRDKKLAEWMPLPEHIYVKLEDGSRVRAQFDPGQRGEDRLSSVQYLKFDTQGAVPVAIGVDFKPLEAEVPLSDEQRRALRADLQS